MKVTIVINLLNLKHAFVSNMEVDVVVHSLTVTKERETSSTVVLTEGENAAQLLTVPNLLLGVIVSVPLTGEESVVKIQVAPKALNQVLTFVFDMVVVVNANLMDAKRSPGGRWVYACLMLQLPRSNNCEKAIIKLSK